MFVEALFLTPTLSKDLYFFANGDHAFHVAYAIAKFYLKIFFWTVKLSSNKKELEK